MTSPAPVDEDKTLGSIRSLLELPKLLNVNFIWMERTFTRTNKACTIRAKITELKGIVVKLNNAIEKFKRWINMSTIYFFTLSLKSTDCSTA